MDRYKDFLKYAKMKNYNLSYSEQYNIFRYFNKEDVKFGDFYGTKYGFDKILEYYEYNNIYSDKFRAIK